MKSFTFLFEINDQITSNMNFIKRPFHHTNSASTTATPPNIRDPLTVSSSSSPPSTGKTSSSLTGSVRFNDLISAQPKFNDREKYLTA